MLRNSLASIYKQLKHELVKLCNIDSRFSLNYRTHSVTPGASPSDPLKIYGSASSFGLIIKFLRAFQPALISCQSASISNQLCLSSRKTLTHGQN